ncbi:hypothetical protein CLAFUW4_07586 [Fulvia fulva]|uniref:Uncharacterized protein n=1 Tax=Passalora fulva TaxID=5499 RepID=A0A9Q8PAR6_PASFU|nr:uncharacterized protein CLAFUR5_07716 [Fulvia fulva]KAK4621644.1 hypothetical protein CLAFUR4_07592 [Fulvia fulva]KAK4623461.1 hypothetical protein CLAFUR0_07591 [Fulvia fulva]UJO19027.1 hypothetical protein CLAFUR5_07716 [Fulvia fulva]WPV16443.1 hypothetical protein CLAFUW4_07586 [Fulvia fulva]WPV31289.1 hypothetical protein CLAFUW7_07588 [Fulvia fulva]
MQYPTILLSALAATSALALPQLNTAVQDTSIRVTLAASSLATQTAFEEAQLPQSKPPIGTSGPFDKVTLTLGDDIKNQTLRCQILDTHHNPIVIVRGANVDTTIADGDAGTWTFRDGASQISKITCDPNFVKSVAPPPPSEKDNSILVTLSNGHLISTTEFLQAGEVREVQHPQGSNGPFTSFELTLGKDVKNQALHCKVLDEKDHKVTAQRGENVDTTFADGGNGPWKFLRPAKTSVSKIVCDPEFVKASQ